MHEETLFMRRTNWQSRTRLETTNLAAKYGKNKKPDPWSG